VIPLDNSLPLDVVDLSRRRTSEPVNDLLKLRNPRICFDQLIPKLTLSRRRRERTAGVVDDKPIQAALL
jgi:hypothetical protein